MRAHPGEELWKFNTGAGVFAAPSVYMRFGDWSKLLWALVGLVPAAMFATGSLMWWNRVIRPQKT